MTDPVDPNQPPAYPQPYPSPPYSPPPPTVAPYEPQQYGQPQPYSSPHHAYSWPGPVPAWDELPRRRSVLLPVLIVVALLIVGAVGWVIASGGNSSSGQIAAPEHIGSYELLHNATAQQVTARMRAYAANAPGAGSLISRATVAEYALDSGDQPSLIVMIFRATDVGGASNTIDSLQTGLSAVAGPSAVTTMPAGTHGGTTSCATIPLGVQSETACVWQDTQTAGLVESVDGSHGVDQVGQTVVQLQDLIDH